MIKLVQGDILKADVEALVNTVNCVGFMGRGIAAQFKRAFPENFRVYEAACRQRGLQPGRMLVVETGQLTNPRYIVNFPTKRHWRGRSRIEDIESGLEALAAEITRRRIKSVAVPPLGCGLGGLDWSEVRPRIEAALGELPGVQVLVYEPAGAPRTEHMARSSKAPKMTPGRAVLVGLVDRYLAGLMDPSVSLLEIHKLMYFAQEAGEPLQLTYVKGLYGPYATNLRHVLSRIEGHLVTGYADGGDDPEKELELVPGARDDAAAFLHQSPATKARFDRVASLVEGFESSFGMELLSTVHWIAAHENAAGPDTLVDSVYAWNERKRRFTPDQILLARDVLTSGGWLPPRPSAHA